MAWPQENGMVPRRTMTATPIRANRLVTIIYAGGTKTRFSYDGMNRWVRLTEETAGGTVTGEKRFVWEGMTLAEERDASNAVTRRFFAEGEQIGGTPYLVFRDHLGSVREMTTPTGTVAARYDYDPYGRRTKLSGALEADFGYTGHYHHAPSNLTVAPFRFYDPDMRWLSRDPIEEEGGMNLYGYCGGGPLGAADPSGLYSFREYLGDVGEVFKGYGDVLNPVNWARSAGTIYAEGEMNGIGAAGAIVVDGVVETVHFWNAESPRDFGNRFGGTLSMVSPFIKRIPFPRVRTAAAAGASISRFHPVTKIPFDVDGFAIFDDCAKADVSIGGYKGSRRADYKAANAAAGLRETPEGYLWHHHQDVGRMQLVPRKIHERTGHTGGWSIWGGGNKR